MVGDKIKYTCKNCGWTTSIRQEWTDLKPKRCMNRKCNTSFSKHVEALVVQMPEEEKIVVVSKKSKKNEDKND